MIAQILSVRSMSINDSDVQKRDCERKRLRGKVIKRETAAGGRRSGACRSVWLPADTNMALSVLCQSDINQSPNQRCRPPEGASVDPSTALTR